MVDVEKPDSDEVATSPDYALVYIPDGEEKTRFWFLSRRAREAFFVAWEQANSESTDACAVVAYMFLMGYVSRDDSRLQAEYWARKSADGGNDYGYWVLAWVLLESGRTTEGMEMMLRSADGLFPAALYDLGQFWMNGVIVKQDAEFAMALLSRAARSGHHGSKYAVNELRRRGRFGLLGLLSGWAIWPIDWMASKGILFRLYNADINSLIHVRFIDFHVQYRRDHGMEPLDPKIIQLVQELRERTSVHQSDSANR